MYQKKTLKRLSFLRVLPVILVILAFASVIMLSGCFDIYPRGEEISEGDPDWEEPPPEEHFDEHPQEHHEEHFEGHDEGEPPHEEHHEEEHPEPPPEDHNQSQQQPKPQQPQQQGQQSQGTGNWTTDVALTDIYPGNQPQGKIHVNVTNHGPGTLNKVDARIIVSGSESNKNNPNNFLIILPSETSVKLSLKPGETMTFPTGFTYDLNINDYEVECTIEVDFNDPDMSNNTMTESYK